MRASVQGALALVAVGCGGRTPLPVEGCFDDPPACVAPGDACGAFASVAAVCDSFSHTWSCRSGSRPYVRAAPVPGACRPFHESSTPLRILVGSLPRIPLDDGRCLWVGDAASTLGGDVISNVGFVVDPTAAFGACPTEAVPVGGHLSSIVSLQDPDPMLSVQIAGAYRIDGRTRILYRLFEASPTEALGVRLLGSGLADWDANREVIAIPGPDSLRWGPDLDLGDASWVQGATAYVWGCHAPFHGLQDDCVVGRLDVNDTLQLYVGGGRWLASTDASKAAVVFGAASWMSAVFPAPGGGLEHAYIQAWGAVIQSHAAPAPEGPWVDGADLSLCALPPDDAHAFCASPVVHPELQDPTRLGERVISYSVSSLSSDTSMRLAAHPEKYWSRIVWVGR